MAPKKEGVGYGQRARTFILFVLFAVSLGWYMLLQHHLSSHPSPVVQELNSFDPLGILSTQVDRDPHAPIIRNTNLQCKRRRIEESLQGYSQCSLEEHGELAADAAEGQVTTEPIIVQFVSTLPIVHYTRDPDVRRVTRPLTIPRCSMVIHGLWELDDGSLERGIGPDEEAITEPLLSQLLSVWPSLGAPSDRDTKSLWNHEWLKHGSKIFLFASKKEYLEEGLHLHQQFHLTEVLSDIMKTLESEHLLQQETIDGITWFGIEAQRLYQELTRALGGRGIQVICYIDTVKNQDGEEITYWLLRELKLYLQYDEQFGTWQVVDEEDVLSKSESWRDGAWKGKVKFDHEDTIWFVTPDSEIQQ